MQADFPTKLYVFAAGLHAEQGTRCKTMQIKIT